MFSHALSPHEVLAQARRLPTGRHSQARPTALELLWLMGCGVLAATAVGILEFNLKIPGHAILRAVFPLVCGLAIVPRRGAGTTMSLAAGLTGMAMHLGHWGELSAGSFTSLIVTGPMLDFALRNASSGWRIYLHVALAGMAANWLALGARLSTSAFGMNPLRGHSSLLWRSFTYTICGILAGLICAAIFFRLNSKPSQTDAATWETEPSTAP